MLLWSSKDRYFSITVRVYRGYKDCDLSNDWTIVVVDIEYTIVGVVDSFTYVYINRGYDIDSVYKPWELVM